MDETNARTPPSAALAMPAITGKFGSEIRLVLQSIDHAASIDALHQAAKDLRGLVHHLVEHAPADSLTRTISSLNDYLTTRVIQMISAGNVPDTIRWCWIALGSEARHEQTLSSDQDNAIIFDSDSSAEATRAQLLPVALRINETLDRCGFPLCPGNIMASNPRWCLNAHEWRECFLDWINESNPEALLNATIFFDLRPLVGSYELAQALVEWLGANASGNPRFLFLMADNALHRKPPLGWFHAFAVDKGGRFAGTIDLKVNGVTLFVDAARIYALSCGVTASNTADRFALAGQRRFIPEVEVQSWTNAFQFVQTLRLKYQQRCHGLGAAMHNHVDPDRLDASERGALLDAMRVARGLQQRVALDFLRGTRPL
jgi:CBS domain-containing protein